MITMCDFEALTTPTNVKVSQANGLIPGPQPKSTFRALKSSNIGFEFGLIYLKKF